MTETELEVLLKETIRSLPDSHPLRVEARMEMEKAKMDRKEICEFCCLSLGKIVRCFSCGAYVCENCSGTFSDICLECEEDSDGYYTEIKPDENRETERE